MTPCDWLTRGMVVDEELFLELSKSLKERECSGILYFLEDYDGVTILRLFEVNLLRLYKRFANL